MQNGAVGDGEGLRKASSLELPNIAAPAKLPREKEEPILPHQSNAMKADAI